MPTEQHKREPLHDHDLELANRGGILLSDSETTSESEQSPAPKKRRGEQTHDDPEQS